jgi:hypothetical protein
MRLRAPVKGARQERDVISRANLANATCGCHMERYYKGGGSSNLADDHQPAPQFPAEPVSRDSILKSQTTVAAGFIFAALTLCFLMWLVTRVDQVQCSRAGLIALVFGLGAALSTSFLGGYAAATGPVIIPYIGDKPVNVAVGGGILALMITTAMAWVVVGKNCVSGPDVFENCKISQPHVHIVCVRVTGLLPPPEGEGTLNVRAGPDLVCKPINVLVNDDTAEVLATHGEWNYVRKLSGNSSGSGAVEGWVSVSFIAATPCPATTQ